MEVLPPLPPETGPPVLPGVVAGEINFLPKLIRLLETLFIFRGAPLALVLQKKKKKDRWRFKSEDNYISRYFTCSVSIKTYLTYFNNGHLLDQPHQVRGKNLKMSTG